MNKEVRKLCNAVKEAILEIENSPDDSVQDIFNECLEDWETGLWMDSHYNIDFNENS